MKDSQPKRRTALAVLLLLITLVITLCARIPSSQPLSIINNSEMAVLPSIEYEGKEYVLRPDVSTICFIGNDKARTTPVEGYNGQADMIAVIAIDGNSSKVSIISIPRDSMVEMRRTYKDSEEFYDMVVQQICLAYSYGTNDIFSSNNVCNCVSELLNGLPMDYFFTTDETLVSSVIDELGGIDITATETIPDTDIIAGETQLLDGEDALKYSLWRDESRYGTSNERMERQQQVIDAVIERINSLIKNDPTRIFDICNIALTDGVTDITFPEALAVARRLEVTNASDIEFYVLPGQTVHDRSNQWDEYIVNEHETLELVLDVFYEES